MSSSSQATPGQPAGRHGGGTGETKERPGLIGLPLAIVGAVVLLIGVTSVNWYNVPNMNTLVTMANHEPYLLGVKVPTDTKFTHFGALAKLLHAGLAQFLAGPAGWVLIVLLIVFAIVANLPFGKIAQWLRIVTPVLAVVGLALLVFAIKGFWHQAANYHLALAGPLPTPDGGTTQVMTMHDGLMMVPALAPTMQGGQPDWSLAWSKLPLGTLQHTGAGLWLGVIGFVLVGVAAVFGPRRVAANKA